MLRCADGLRGLLIPFLFFVDSPRATAPGQGSVMPMNLSGVHGRSVSRSGHPVPAWPPGTTPAGDRGRAADSRRVTGPARPVHRFVGIRAPAEFGLGGSCDPRGVRPGHHRWTGYDRLRVRNLPRGACAPGGTHRFLPETPGIAAAAGALPSEGGVERVRPEELAWRRPCRRVEDPSWSTPRAMALTVKALSAEPRPPCLDCLDQLRRGGPRWRLICVFETASHSTGHPAQTIIFVRADSGGAGREPSSHQPPFAAKPAGTWPAAPALLGETMMWWLAPAPASTPRQDPVGYGSRWSPPRSSSNIDGNCCGQPNLQAPTLVFEASGYHLAPCSRATWDGEARNRRRASRPTPSASACRWWFHPEWSQKWPAATAFSPRLPPRGPSSGGCWTLTRAALTFSPDGGSCAGPAQGLAPSSRAGPRNRPAGARHPARQGRLWLLLARCRNYWLRRVLSLPAGGLAAAKASAVGQSYRRDRRVHARPRAINLPPGATPCDGRGPAARVMVRTSSCRGRDSARPARFAGVGRRGAGPPVRRCGAAQADGRPGARLEQASACAGSAG